MRIKLNLIVFYTMLHREITRVARIWSQTLLPPVMTMSLYFVIFGNLIGPRIGVMQGIEYIHYIIPGLIMMSIITNSYSNVVSSFFGAKFQRYIEEMLVSPMPNYIMLWGFLAGGIFRGLLVGFLVLLVASYFGDIHFYQLSVVISVALLTATLFSLAGVLNGIFAKKFDDISIVPTFVLTPLTYLGGIFYSIDLLPSFWQKVTHLNPVFYMVNAFRYGMLGKSDIPIEHSLGIIVVFIVVLYMVSLYLLNQGIGIKS